MRLKTFINLILINAVVWVVVNYRDVAINFYNNFDKQIQSFQKTDIKSTLTQIGEKILSPFKDNIAKLYSIFNKQVSYISKPVSFFQLKI